MGAQFSRTVDFRGFLDAVSLVLKYYYLYCFIGTSNIWFACYEVMLLSGSTVTNHILKRVSKARVEQKTMYVLSVFRVQAQV